MKNLNRTIRIASIVIFLVTGIVSTGRAQDYEVPVPEDYEFKDAEDYRKYEKDILECSRFILTSSPLEGGQTWNDASAWLLKWIAGSPDYTLTIRPEIFNYIHKKNYNLLIYFMAGWIENSLANKVDDQMEGNIAGMNAMVGAYKDFDIWKKDKKMEKLIAEKDQNEEAIEDMVRSWYR